MSANDHLSGPQFKRYKVTFKTPGGSHIEHELDAPDGHTAHRLAALRLRAAGISRQVGVWSSYTKEA